MSNDGVYNRTTRIVDNDARFLLLTKSSYSLTVYLVFEVFIRILPLIVGCTDFRVVDTLRQLC